MADGFSTVTDVDDTNPTIKNVPLFAPLAAPVIVKKFPTDEDVNAAPVIPETVDLPPKEADVGALMVSAAEPV